MALDNRFVILEETRKRAEENYESSMSKIQRAPYYMLRLKNYGKYLFPNLISIGPIHHGVAKLKRGEQHKLMWASMYAEANQQTPQVLHKRIADNIARLRGFFSWHEIGLADNHYSNDDLAWMLFVDGCSVLQIFEKANLSRLEDLKVKVDIVAIVRDLLLLENQLPYEVLKLLSEDESKLKLSMYSFCELQNMFTVIESPYSLPFTEPEHQIEIIMHSSPPTHLLDCLRTCILSSGMDSIDKGKPQLEEGLTAHVTSAHANKKERYISYRNIQELKAAAIGVKRQKNISLKNICFSSSLFGGNLHLPPLFLDDSTVTILLNLVAYEMCPDFKNKFEISSFIKLLDVLVDSPEDVKELRSSGILHNSLGSDEEVVEFFNVGSTLLHSPTLYSRIREVIEMQYKRKLSIWMVEAYYTYFRSPWTIIASLAALIILVLTTLQTWQAFESNSK
ncbi:hypothetical protein L6164_002140 [Bauhinia variegata]|uniref:Uncharacterized protein n=1 Tax=Bauhinia variegata TaxID=167791 RepID=A0ACB9PYS1_BAUVA|nr:hypothetical protein L6164_002140 [Bauhinia variegata]